MDLHYFNEEQRHQIEIHKYLTSEKMGRDRSDEACLEWIKLYAASFRKWAETIPDKCIGCGFCDCVNQDKECEHPFNKIRINKIENDRTS